MNYPPPIIRSTRACYSDRENTFLSGDRQPWPQAADTYCLTPPASPRPQREQELLELQRQLQAPAAPLRKQPQYLDIETDSDLILSFDQGPVLPRKRPLQMRSPLPMRSPARRPLSMRPLPRPPHTPARNEEARLSSSFVHLSCGIYGGAHEQQVSTEEAPPSDDGSSCSFGFDMDEDQEEQPTSQKSYGNFLFDEDQEMEDEVRTHDGAPAPTQVAATPSGSKDGGCLSRSPSSIMFFDNFSY